MHMHAVYDLDVHIVNREHAGHALSIEFVTVCRMSKMTMVTDECVHAIYNLTLFAQ
jgi:hypothetical protein